MKRILMVVVGLGIILAACSPDRGIEVRDAWARPAPQGGNGAVYFVIENHSSETQEIMGVASDSAEAVEMHESQMNADVMEMHPLESVTLEPRTDVVFEPGGLHVMLVGLKQELKVGDQINVTLQFSNSQELTIQVPVMDEAEENH